MYSSSQRTPGGALGKRKRNDTVGPVRKRFRKPRPTYRTIDKLKSRDAKAFGLFKYSGEGPFPQKLATTLLYRSIPVNATGSAVTGTYAYSCALNNCNDFDVTNILGNKQPLYWDTLMTANGPYQQWECKSWRTRVTVINLGAEAVAVYWNGRGSVISSSEDDSLAEVVNRPYTQQKFLAPKGGTGDRCVFFTSGKITDHFDDDVTLSAAYNASAPQIIYGNVFFNTPTNTTAPNFILQIDHYMDVVCTKIDGTTS